MSLMEAGTTVGQKAENTLKEMEHMPLYPLTLLQIVDNTGHTDVLRLMAAVSFKNFIKKFWHRSDNIDDRINDQNRQLIRNEIVGLMLKHQRNLRDQLSEAISIIGKEDFPQHWEQLIIELRDKMQTTDYSVINGVLQTAHSIFKRYRVEFRSNALFSEIIYVMKNFAEPLTMMFVRTCDCLVAALQAPNGSRDYLFSIYESIMNMCKIFLSLSTQDLPEYFEDNMAIWMEKFALLVDLDVPLLAVKADTPGPVETVRMIICEIVTLYATHYDEEFGSYLQCFVQKFWELMLKVGMEHKYDELVSTSINFLARIAAKPHYKYLFETSDTLKSLCEKIVLPNMQMQDDQVAEFMDDPEEFIRSDLLGSNVGTRRRAACELVRALCRSFEQQVVADFSAYVTFLLQEYQKAPEENYRCKDTALYLVTSLAALGQTDRYGAVQTPQVVQLEQFYLEHVQSELAELDGVNRRPMVKAACVKFLLTFRSLLPHTVLQANVALLIPYIAAEHAVVSTYACHALERLLMVSQNDASIIQNTIRTTTPSVKVAVISAQHLPKAEELLCYFDSAFRVVGCESNEFAMKALLRVCATLDKLVLPVLQPLIAFLQQKLTEICQNPARPNFNHFLFETVCLLVRIGCRTDRRTIVEFEGVLMPILQNILQRDIIDFVPYSFQVLALLYQLHSETGMTGIYEVLFPVLLSPPLWESNANVPGLTSLLQVYLLKAHHDIVFRLNKLNDIMGLFQRLNASKATDHHGFALLSTVVACVEPVRLEPYFTKLFMLIFARLNQGKTAKYVSCTLTFFAHCINRLGADQFIKLVDRVQPRIFEMIAQSLLLPEMRKIVEPRERQLCAIAFITLLCSAQEMQAPNGSYQALWCPLLEKLLEYIELPREEEELGEDAGMNRFQEIHDLENGSSFQGNYNHLQYAGNRLTIPFENSSVNPKVYLPQQLAKLSQTHPILSRVTTPKGGLTSGAWQCLQTFAQEAQVNLS